jgi:hypothetical protein
MRTLFSVLLLTIGIVLLILGFSASDSVSSGVSRVFRGTPSDRATILLLIGAAASVTGLVGVFLSFRSRPPA